MSPGIQRLVKDSIQRKILVVLMGVLPVSGWSQTPTGAEILQKIDDNTMAGNRSATTTMIVRGRRGDRAMTAKSWIEGADKSFSEYLAPAREKGTKMLKLEDQLWIYSPETDRTIRISGHMLRQSVMGSDLSYEDMMEDPELHEMYSSEVVGEEEIDGRPCWVLELTAREGKEVAYAARRIWVDQERFLPLREERLARSGKLLKTTRVKGVMQVGERWVIRHVVFKDALKEGKGTELIVDEVEYDVEIPPHMFSKAALRR